MSATILQVYQTEVDWLALIELADGMKVTFRFDHEPTESEIATNAAAFEASLEPPESEYEIECEDGQVV